MSNSNEKIHILVIDDEPVMRLSCKKALQMEGVNIDCVENGILGIAKLHDQPYDVVLIDLMMPQLSGMHVLETIQKMNPDIVTIVITGYATKEVAEDAMKNGAFEYLAKPFTPDELRAVVNNGLQARKTRISQSRQCLD
ncbi:MAG: response regulator [Candidatus Zhuqueibacterota bacterium]